MIQMTTEGSARLRRARDAGVMLGEAWLPAAGMLALLYHWFVVANRGAVFLYGHRDAGPWDPITRGRYWMAPLVAAGAVAVPYLLLKAGWSLWRRGRGYMAAPRSAAELWAWGVLPLASGTTWIVAGLGRPPLPWDLSVSVVVAALAGLGLVLAAGRVAAQDTARLVWLAARGAGLLPAMVFMRVLELPTRGIGSPVQMWGGALGGLLVGTLWLLAACHAARWWGMPAERAPALWLAGAALAYLALPLGHHLLLAPAECRYITASENLFAQSWALQTVAWVVAAAQALLAARLVGGGPRRR